MSLNRKGRSVVIRSVGLAGQPEMEPSMIVVTTENVTGHRTVRMLGQCFGVVVRSHGLGGNLVASLRSIVGGEIHEYTQMLEEARRHALDRLVTTPHRWARMRS